MMHRIFYKLLLLLSGIVVLFFTACELRINKPKKGSKKNKIAQEYEKQKQWENKKARTVLSPNQAWFNVLHYDISVAVYPQDSLLRGSVLLTYEVLRPQSLMELDVQLPLQVDSIVYYGGEEERVVPPPPPIRQAKHRAPAKPKPTRKNTNAPILDRHQASVKSIRMTFSAMQEKIYVQVPKDKIGAIRRVKIYYQGKPRRAINPPWQGGMVWGKDSLGRDFIGLATQEAGASLWFPCKDYWGDKADRGASVSISVPKGLQAVSNGALLRSETDGARSTFYWQVHSPISPYNLTFYAGYYKYGEMPSYEGMGGKLPLAYWVLDYHEQQARLHFRSMPIILRSFEYWLGAYPFYKDPFQLVESPYLGMEYQSAIAYGNGYKNGYKGKDRSGSGFGNYWDFVLVHETAHQWFGNRVSALSVRDMWIQESFATYAETLFTESLFSALAGTFYVKGQRALVRNRIPIFTDALQQDMDADMYYKGANMLHTLRTLIGNDATFRNLLHAMTSQLLQPLSTEDMIAFVNQFLKRDLSWFFKQYLERKSLPVLQYKVDKKRGAVSFQWARTRDDFIMPVKLAGKEYLLRKNKWARISLGDQFSYLPAYLKEIEDNYYVSLERVGGVKEEVQEATQEELQE